MFMVATTAAAIDREVEAERVAHASLVPQFLFLLTLFPMMIGNRLRHRKSSSTSVVGTARLSSAS